MSYAESISLLARLDTPIPDFVQLIASQENLTDSSVKTLRKTMDIDIAVERFFALGEPPPDKKSIAALLDKNKDRASHLIQQEHDMPPTHIINTKQGMLIIYEGGHGVLIREEHMRPENISRVREILEDTIHENRKELSKLEEALISLPGGEPCSE